LTNNKRLRVYGNRALLEKCVADNKFAYVVALARAINALNGAHSLMNATIGKNTPAAQRDRTNSHFLISAVLYETLNLIRKMAYIFNGDESFEKSLKLILRDPSAQVLEQMHLKAARNDTVFHFLPDKFAEALEKTDLQECVFDDSIGTRFGDVHYAFADLIATEMMVGTKLDDTIVVPQMFERTLNLVVKFIDYSEAFIVEHLNNWGFELRESVIEGESAL
jgi:hypothetical protein